MAVERLKVGQWDVQIAQAASDGAEIVGIAFRIAQDDVEMLGTLQSFDHGGIEDGVAERVGGVVAELIRADLEFHREFSLVSLSQQQLISPVELVLQSAMVAAPDEDLIILARDVILDDAVEEAVEVGAR